MDRPYIVLDLETKKTFEDIGTYQDGYDQLGVSFAGVYSSTQNAYFGFFEHELDRFESILREERPFIVGFNTIGFDLPVLQPYMPDLPLLDFPQVDMLDELHRSLGHRVKLESVAQATLGEGKSGTGLDAIRYYREQNFEALATYCLDDVRITKELFVYGQKHGKLYYTNAGAPTPVSISFGNSQSIEARLKEAVEAHQELKLKILSLSPDGESKTFETVFEPQRMETFACRGYCHFSQKEVAYEIRFILNMKVTGNQVAHQESLL